MDSELTRSAEEIDRYLRAIRQVLRQPIETEMTRSGITAPQQNVMRALVHSQGLSLKDLSRQVGLAHSTVSGIVDRLEKQGLLERKPDTRDRRFTLIAASPRVRKYVRDTLPQLSVHPLVEVLQRAKPHQRKQIIEGVRCLAELLDKSR